LSDVYFNDTVKLLDVENPLFGATFDNSISCISRVLANFVSKTVSWLPW